MEWGDQWESGRVPCELYEEVVRSERASEREREEREREKREREKEWNMREREKERKERGSFVCDGVCLELPSGMNVFFIFSFREMCGKSFNTQKQLGCVYFWR